MKLTKEQIMVAGGMIGRGVSIRQVARQLGVRESALRYRLRRQREGAVDGRAGKPTALDPFEAAVHEVLVRLNDVRVTGEGRPVQARQVYEVLIRDRGFTGSYKSVVRHLRRSRRAVRGACGPSGPCNVGPPFKVSPGSASRPHTGLKPFSGLPTAGYAISDTLTGVVS